MIYSTDLSDSHRAAGAVAGYQTFVVPQIWRRKRKQSIRAIINGILYVVKGGISWRMMPNDLPDWRWIYYYFRQWAKQRLVQQIHDKLVTKVRLQASREASPSLGLVKSIG